MTGLRTAAVAVSALGCLAVASFAQAQQAAGNGERSRSLRVSADVNHGRFLATNGEYGEHRIACASCHGMDGKGDESGAFPRLTDQSEWYLYTSLRAFATGERPSEVMGPIAAELSEEDMQDLAAYYATRHASFFPAAVAPDETLHSEGERIVAQGDPDSGLPACSTCHGPGAVGDAPLYPYLAGQARGYLEQQLKLFRKGERGGDMANVMHAVAKNMTDHQISAVAQYLANERPGEVTPGANGPGGNPVPPAPIPFEPGADTDAKPVSGKTVLLEEQQKE